MRCWHGACEGQGVTPVHDRLFPTLKETSMIRLIAIILAAALASLLAACNTVEGAGKDVSASGHAISKAAEKSEP
jgi:predicted small secreted protein